jgi:hypothetical protein
MSPAGRRDQGAFDPTIAVSATILDHFALAQDAIRQQLGRAFQASSPKNFSGLPFGVALFSCPFRAEPASYVARFSEPAKGM